MKEHTEKLLKNLLTEWGFSDVNIQDKCYQATDMDMGSCKDVNLKYFFNLLFLDLKYSLNADSKSAMYALTRNLVSGTRVQLKRIKFQKILKAPKVSIKPRRVSEAAAATAPPAVDFETLINGVREHQNRIWYRVAAGERPVPFNAPPPPENNEQ